MEECTIKTPLGIAKITGDIKGIMAVSIVNTEKKSIYCYSGSARRLRASIKRIF